MCIKNNNLTFWKQLWHHQCSCTETWTCRRWWQRRGTWGQWTPRSPQFRLCWHQQHWTEHQSPAEWSSVPHLSMLGSAQIWNHEWQIKGLNLIWSYNILYTMKQKCFIYLSIEPSLLMSNFLKAFWTSLVVLWTDLNFETTSNEVGTIILLNSSMSICPFWSTSPITKIAFISSSLSLWPLLLTAD